MMTTKKRRKMRTMKILLPSLLFCTILSFPFVSVQVYGSVATLDEMLDAIWGPDTPDNPSILPPEVANLPGDAQITPEQQQLLDQETDRRSNLTEQEQVSDPALSVQPGPGPAPYIPPVTNVDPITGVEWKTFEDRDGLFTVQYPENWRPVAINETERAGPIHMRFEANMSPNEMREDTWASIEFIQFADKSVYKTAEEEQQSVIDLNENDPELLDFVVQQPTECERYSLNDLRSCSYLYGARSEESGTWYGLEVEAVADDGTDFNVHYMGKPVYSFEYWNPEVDRMIESFQTTTPAPGSLPEVPSPAEIDPRAGGDEQQQVQNDTQQPAAEPEAEPGQERLAYAQNDTTIPDEVMSTEELLEWRQNQSKQYGEIFPDTDILTDTCRIGKTLIEQYQECGSIGAEDIPGDEDKEFPELPAEDLEALPEPERSRE
jgi:hypothetical protein